MPNLGVRRARQQAERAALEIRAARVEHALTIAAIGRRAGVSRDTVRRVELGDPGVAIDTLCAVGEAVGLDIVVSAYRGRPLSLRDTGQLEIARMVIAAAHPSWEARLEATAGDHGEAADLLFLGPVEIIDVEIDRWLGDFQDRYRRNTRKREWIAAHHQRPVRLVMAVEDAHRNRATVAIHEDVVRQVLPARSRVILRALANGRPLGRDGLLWIRRREPPRRYIAVK